MSVDTQEAVIPAEQAVLGALMLSPNVARDVVRVLGASDFYSPRHQLIYEGILRLIEEKAPYDTVTVVDELLRNGSLDRAGGADYVHDLTSNVVATSSAGYYAGMVQEAAVGRAITQVAISMQDMIVRGEQPGVALARAQEDLAAIRDRQATERAARTLGQVLDVPATVDSYDWVVPGALERMDRLILTGAEGGGKSMLLRQIAIMTAAGIQPFTRERVRPARVLVVDAENSERQWRRSIRPLAVVARRDGHVDPRETLAVDFNARLDVTKAKDLGHVHRMIDDWKPDLVVIGPLYRLAPSIKNDEEALPVLHALDTIRDRGVAMMIEAHAPHADAKSGARDLRPIGSSALLRWPEFGLGIAKPSKPGEPYQLVHWRGDRDARPWPTTLLSQRETYAQTWPWEPTADYTHSAEPAPALI